MRLSLVVCRTNNNLTTVGGDARWCVDPDHVVADDLEISHFSATREFYFCHTIKTGTIDGHRLVGDDLRREERFNTQSDVGRFSVVFRAS